MKFLPCSSPVHFKHCHGSGAAFTGHWWVSELTVALYVRKLLLSPSPTQTLRLTVIMKFFLHEKTKIWKIGLKILDDTLVCLWIYAHSAIQNTGPVESNPFYLRKPGDLFMCFAGYLFNFLHHTIFTYPLLFQCAKFHPQVHIQDPAFYVFRLSGERMFITHDLHRSIEALKLEKATKATRSSHSPSTDKAHH